MKFLDTISGNGLTQLETRENSIFSEPNAPIDEMASVQELHTMRKRYISALEKIRQRPDADDQIAETKTALTIYQDLCGLEQQQIASKIARHKQTISDVEKSQQSLLTASGNMPNGANEIIAAFEHNQAVIRKIEAEIKKAQRLSRLITRQLEQSENDARKFLESIEDAKPLTSQTHDKATQELLRKLGVDANAPIETIHVVEEPTTENMRDFPLHARGKKLLSTPKQPPNQNPDDIERKIHEIEAEVELNTIKQAIRSKPRSWKNAHDILQWHFKHPIVRTAREINKRLAKGIKDEYTLELMLHRREIMRLKGLYEEKYADLLEENKAQVKKAETAPSQPKALLAASTDTDDIYDAYVSPLDDDSLSDLQALRKYNYFSYDDMERRRRDDREISKTEDAEFLEHIHIPYLMDEISRTRAEIKRLKSAGKSPSFEEDHYKETQKTMLAAYRRVKALKQEEVRPETLSLNQQSQTSILGGIKSLVSAFTKAAKNTAEVAAAMILQPRAAMAAVLALSTGTALSPKEAQRIETPTAKIAFDAAQLPEIPESGLFNQDDVEKILGASPIAVSASIINNEQRKAACKYTHGNNNKQSLDQCLKLVVS